MFSFKQGRLEEAERGQRLSQGKSWPVSLLWIPEQGWAKVKLRGGARVWLWGWNFSCGLKLLRVAAAVWPKEKGVPMSKTERPVLQPACAEGPPAWARHS